MPTCFAYRIGILKILTIAQYWWRYKKTHSLGNFWKNKSLKLFWRAFLPRHQNVNENEKKMTILLTNMDGSWKHVERQQKGKQKRTHIVWLHSYKVQKQVKLMYGVRSQARSSIWGEGINNWEGVWEGLLGC